MKACEWLCVIGTHRSSAPIGRARTSELLEHDCRLLLLDLSKMANMQRHVLAKKGQQDRWMGSSAQVPSVRSFRRLVRCWKANTAHFSSLTKIVLDPAYQRIIGMGAPAIPLLLAELKSAPDHWFWALSAITGEDPVLPHQRGKLNLMAAAWIEWGKRHGYE